MKNSEKFKTAEERASAYEEFCSPRLCDECELRTKNSDYSVDVCMAFWLDLEAEEEQPLPCPFCGHEVDVISTLYTNLVACKVCGYYSQRCESAESAIAAHNRVARAARGASK